MFSGIVETQSKLLLLTSEDHTAQIKIARPQNWLDLKTGDSIAVNGICLTIQSLTDTELTFVLGPETLKILQSTDQFFGESGARPLNLERSLPINARMHGHFVLGHVDGVGVVTEAQTVGQAHYLAVRLPEMAAPFVWYKGSIALSGVSLTINEVHGSEVKVCLIPETIRSTNLTHYKVGDQIPFEIDNMARAWVRQIELKKNLEHP